MSARAGGANAPERWHVIHDTGAALFTERNLREQIGLLPFGSAINVSTLVDLCLRVASYEHISPISAFSCWGYVGESLGRGG